MILKETVLDQAIEYQKNLDNSSLSIWAENFVNFRLNFMRKYGFGYIFSTGHGIDFFNNVISSLRDGKVWLEECEMERPGKKKEKSELGESFRKWITKVKENKI